MAQFRLLTPGFHGDVWVPTGSVIEMPDDTVDGPSMVRVVPEVAQPAPPPTMAPRSAPKPAAKGAPKA